MPSPFKNIAVAGATGNTGPTVIKTLITSGFKVTVLTRFGSVSKAESLLEPSTEVIEVDYLSHESLVSALRGIDAVVVCGVGMLPEQTNLIDAAISAGVSRFFPADFAADLSNPRNRALQVHRNKILTEDYLQKNESEISHTSIRTGPLLDYLLGIGVLVNLKAHSAIRYDSGDKRFSTTTIETASKAVVAALRMGDKSENRTFRVQDIVTTQNELLKLAKEILPGAEWSINSMSTTNMEKMSKEAFEKDPNSAMGGMLQKAVGVFGTKFISDYGEADNAELGIKMMDEAQVKELMGRFV